MSKTMKAGKLIGYTVFDGAYISGGKLSTGSKISAYATRKLRVRREALAPDHKLYAMGYRWRFTLTGRAYMRRQQERHPRTFDEIKLFSKHDELLVDATWAPEPFLRLALPPLTELPELVELDAAVVADDAAKTHQRLDAAKARLGVAFSAEDRVVADAVETFLKEGKLDESQMRAMTGARRLDQPELAHPYYNMALAQGKPAENGDGEDAATMQYGAVDGILIANAAVPDEQGRLHNMPLLKLGILSKPEYHALEEGGEHEQFRKAGYVGYWQFPQAVIPEKVIDTPHNAVISFTVVSNNTVFVRAMDTITPAGRIAVPLPVYEAMAGRQPEHIMDFTEADALMRAQAQMALTQATGSRN